MKKIIVDASFPSETRVVLLDKNGRIEDIEFENSSSVKIKGNIYLAKVTRVEPALQAAFVDYGNEKSGFLPFCEIHQDYYHIPLSDQKSAVERMKSIAPPEITSEDLKAGEKEIGEDSVDSDEIDLRAIEKMVDEKLPSDLDYEEEDPETPSLKKSDKDLSSYKIQDVIKKGQVLLIQAVKEERGSKGASFSTYISLAGKYCVLIPNKGSHDGISKKISNPKERKRLKEILDGLNSQTDKSHVSVIVRTAGIGRSSLEIKKDYDYLARLWNKIREATLKSQAPSFVHEEEGVLQRVVRDMFDRNVKEVIVQGSEAYRNVSGLMKEMMPGQVESVKEYREKTPIFTKFEIEDQISGLYRPIVTLPSGGYAVINPTEALTSIDVNSGRAVSEKDIEETALKTNMEAARELARQIKLRGLGGIIVIDFIDMYSQRNRKIIERSIKEFLSRDKARIQISSISQFGLLEISRQRIGQSFLEQHSSICAHCNGKGVVRSAEPNATLMLRTVENEIYKEKVDIVNVYANLDSVIYTLNNKAEEIFFISKKYGIKLNFLVDDKATSDSYSIEKIKKPQGNKRSEEKQKPFNPEAPVSYEAKPEKREPTKKRKWTEVAGDEDKYPQKETRSKEKEDLKEEISGEDKGGNLEDPTQKSPAALKTGRKNRGRRYPKKTKQKETPASET